LFYDVLEQLRAAFHNRAARKGLTDLWLSPVLRSSFVHHSFIIRSSFVHHSFIVRSAFVIAHCPKFDGVILLGYTG
jgi:hypothetical protein